MMHYDLSRFLCAIEVLWQAGDRLKFVQRTSLGIIGERGDGRPHFLQHIDKSAIRREGEMARPGPRVHLAKCRIVGYKRSRAGIKSVDQQLIQPEIGRNGESSVWRDFDLVRVR